ncbi:MAG: caspase family protein [Cytophagaceae bacterium]|jgi:WD40 repeat protein|nr:caspase family protein [Cytophagaceae bacterium]
MKYIHLFAAYLFFFIMLGSKSIHGQSEPSLLISSGHQASINALDFHPKGTLLASGGSDFQILLWNLPRQCQVKTLTGHAAPILALKFNAAGDALISMDQNGEVISWDLASGAVLQKINIGMLITNQHFFFDGSPDYVYLPMQQLLIFWNYRTGIITKQLPLHRFAVQMCATRFRESYLRVSDSQPGALGIFSLSSGQELYSISVGIENFGELRKIRSNTSNSLVASANERFLFIFDLDKRILFRKIKLNVPVDDLAFSADGNKIILSSINHEGISVYDAYSGKIVTEYSFPPEARGFHAGSGKVCLAAHPVQAYMASSSNYDGNFRIQMYALDQNRLLISLGAASHRVIQIQPATLSDQLHTCIEGEYRGIQTWDIQEGKILHTSLSSGKSPCSIGGDTGAYIRADTCLLLQLSTHETIGKIPFEKPYHVRISKNGKTLLLWRVLPSHRSDYWGVKNLPYYQTYVYDLNGSLTRTPSLFTMEDDPGSFGHLSDDGLFFCCLSEDQHLAVYDLRTGTRQKYPTRFVLQRIHGFVPGSHQVLLSGMPESIQAPTELSIFDVSTGVEVRRFNSGIMQSIQMACVSTDGEQIAISAAHGLFDTGKQNFNIHLFNFKTGAKTTELKGSDSEVIQFCWQNERIAYSISYSGKISRWNLSSGLLDLQCISMSNPGEYIITNGTYYKSSRGNFSGIAFQWGSRIFDFSQFDLYFNRPDLIAEQLGAPSLSIDFYVSALNRRWQRNRIDGKNLPAAGFNVPLARAKEPEKIPVSSLDNLLHLPLQYDHIKQVMKTEIYSNNILVFTSEGAPPLASIPLFQGRNTIDLITYNTDGTAGKGDRYIVYGEKKQAVNLYLACVGINEYQNTRYNLQYAVKDGQDILAQFKQSGYFNQVISKTLQNENVSISSVFELASFFNQAGPNDVLMLHYSSHGLIHPRRKDSWLSTHHTPFDSTLRDCFPLDSLNTIFNDCRSANRVILVDACSTGDKKKQMENYLFSDLQTAGTTVFSATSGSEQAKESNRFQNGIFTYGLLQCLKDSQHAAHQDNMVLLKEWYTWTQPWVFRNSGRKQRPELREWNELNDFRVW